MKKKTVALLMSLVLIFGVAVGGTIAWLMDETGEVKNTFTVGKVEIDLYETEKSEKVMERTYKMVPGDELDKDPTVEVKAVSEACWLFIEVKKSSVLDTYITYAIDDTVWKELDATKYPGVYYCEVADTDALQTFNVLKDKKVTVNSDVTSEQMEALEVAGATQPTLNFKAYAIQKDNIDDVNDAWTKINTPDA